MLEIFQRHQRVAFQFSGGKDSLAALFLLKPYWNQFTVYWTHTGDPVPEVQEFIDWVAGQVPHFKAIQGHQPDIIERYGWPVDVLPADASLFGRLTTGSPATVFQNREACCFKSFMMPMHLQMQRDGITCIVRGQKESDFRKVPIQSGYVEDGIEYYFPVESWTDSQVMEYLHKNSIPIPSFYQWLTSSPDCLTCTAYLDENRKQFLQERHPEAWKKVHFRLTELKHALAAPLLALKDHLEE
jgi:3'-phosphoadenosine 5'-phosphosulfate sulfotransferase (PAPS reductase)/FAD synthetase